jgi:molecular chaperone DnaK
MGGVMTRLIDSNTTIPTKNRNVLTASETSPACRSMYTRGAPNGNAEQSLGMFNLDGLPRRPRGVPQIEVIFVLMQTASCTVRQKTKERKEQKIRIEAGSGLSKDEWKNESRSKANEEQTSANGAG